MATTASEIKNWFMSGVAGKCTHMIVVCDTFEWEDYPVYVHKGDDVNEVIKKYDGVDMQKIMEVYNLSLDMNSQLAESRAYHV